MKMEKPESAAAVGFRSVAAEGARSQLPLVAAAEPKENSWRRLCAPVWMPRVREWDSLCAPASVSLATSDREGIGRRAGAAPAVGERRPAVTTSHPQRGALAMPVPSHRPHRSSTLAHRQPPSPPPRWTERAEIAPGSGFLTTTRSATRSTRPCIRSSSTYASRLREARTTPYGGRCRRVERRRNARGACVGGKRKAIVSNRIAQLCAATANPRRPRATFRAHVLDPVRPEPPPAGHSCRPVGRLLQSFHEDVTGIPKRGRQAQRGINLREGLLPL